MPMVSRLGYVLSAAATVEEVKSHMEAAAVGDPFDTITCLLLPSRNVICRIGGGGGIKRCA